MHNSEASKPCEEVAERGNTLVGLSSSDFDRLENAGAVTCEMGGRGYLVLGQD